MFLRDNGLGRFRGYSLGSNPGGIGPEVCPTLGPEEPQKKRLAVSGEPSIGKL